MPAGLRARVVAVVAALGLILGAACGPTTLPEPAAPSDSAPTPVPADNADPDVVATVTEVLGSALHPGLKWSAIPDVAAALRAVYDAEPDRLVWFNGAMPVAGMGRTIAAIGDGGHHGLTIEDYDAAPLAEQWKTISNGKSAPAERALFDLGVSVAVARMLRAVHLGRVDPATMLWGYDIAAKPFDLIAQFERARREPGVAVTLAQLEPPFAHYQRARQLLADYRARAALGEPPLVPEVPRGQKVEPGSSSWPGVGPLASRLNALGDLPDEVARALTDGDDAADSPPYRGAIVEALKSFQRRHGLEADGVIGSGTTRAVNVPLADRIRQVELSMERMRWLPALSARPNIFVNVALFRLWATDPTTGEEPLRMNVVVGEALDHRTPIFVEQMEYVIFRPYWVPPRSITVKEIVPRARRDPKYLAREDFEIVASGADNAPTFDATSENIDKVAAGRLYVRQRPGPRNSLGLAKFIFPNTDDVYMHGSPAQQLFSRARRDFSHGCIRLEDPARFAEWVLRDQPEWTRERIEKAMQGERPTRVNLKERLTVVLFYATTHINSEGVAFFVDDIYGHDRALDGALVQGYPYPVKAAPEKRAE